jgi:hypothetical protein
MILGKDNYRFFVLTYRKFRPIDRRYSIAGGGAFGKPFDSYAAKFSEEWEGRPILMPSSESVART